MRWQRPTEACTSSSNRSQRELLVRVKALLSRAQLGTYPPRSFIQAESGQLRTLSRHLGLWRLLPPLSYRKLALTGLLHCVEPSRRRIMRPLTRARCPLFLVRKAFPRWQIILLGISLQHLLRRSAVWPLRLP